MKKYVITDTVDEKSIKEVSTIAIKELNNMIYAYLKGTKEEKQQQLANMFTTQRILMSGIVTPAILKNTKTSKRIAAAGAIYAALTDFFDGKAARKYPKENNTGFGALYDQLADKIFAIAVGISLLTIDKNYIIPLIGEALISAINIVFKLIDPNIKIPSTQIGKIKEWPLFIEYALELIPFDSATLKKIKKGVFVTTCIMQVATMTSYCTQNSKELKRKKNNRSSII